MDVMELLVPISGNVVRELGTPQNKAARWMAEDDPIPTTNSLDGTTTTGLEVSDPRFIQRYIMVLFYYALDGERWTNPSNWLSSDSECYWFGIDGGYTDPTCGGSTAAGGCKPRSNLIGDYDKICTISLSRNELYGSLPSELGYLNEMRWFEIQESYITGTIPSSLGNWSLVHTILLGGNYISGNIPSSFVNNELLSTIFVHRNSMNGTFPAVLTTLKNLVWLDVYNNYFTGNIPGSIGNIKTLRRINMNNNSFTGPIPDTWDDTNLIEKFEANDNMLEGTLPPSLGNAMWLTDLHVARNALTGQIPLSYYNLDNLEGLYLEENNIGGELPSPNAAEKFYNGLEELSIHSNKFIGRFPVEQFENTLRISEYNFYVFYFECSYWMEGFHSFFPFTHTRTYFIFFFICVLHMQ
jgi:LRR receptor-like serine/threonine-protein kinase FLS2